MQEAGSRFSLIGADGKAGGCISSGRIRGVTFNERPVDEFTMIPRQKDNFRPVFPEASGTMEILGERLIGLRSRAAQWGKLAAAFSHSRGFSAVIIGTLSDCSR